MPVLSTDEGQFSTPLNVGGFGNARDVQWSGEQAPRPLPPAVVVPVSVPAAGAPCTDDNDALFQELRQKVTWLAIALAALAVIQNFTDYFTEVAEIETAVAEIRDVAPHSWQRRLDHVPDAGTLLAGRFDKVLFSIGMSLLVPACGYFGAKQGNSQLMCCFCGCNLCNACSGIFTVLLCLIGLMAIGQGEPRLEMWLHSCAPEPCLAPTLTRNQTIDCLAGGDRVQRYQDIVHLNSDCPQAFLSCKKASQGDACYNPLLTPTGLSQCSDEVRRAHCQRLEGEVDCGLFGKCHWVPHRMDGGANLPICVPAGLPLDPVEKCEVNHHKVVGFKAMVEIAPIIFSKVASLVTVKLLLTVPTVIIGGLGFYHGKVFYDRLNQGYAYVSGPAGGMYPYPGARPLEQQQLLRSPYPGGSNAVVGPAVAAPAHHQEQQDQWGSESTTTTAGGV